MSLFGAEHPPLELSGGDGWRGFSLARPHFTVNVKPLLLPPAPRAQALRVSPWHPSVPTCSCMAQGGLWGPGTDIPPRQGLQERLKISSERFSQ